MTDEEEWETYLNGTPDHWAVKLIGWVLWVAFVAWLFTGCAPPPPTLYASTRVLGGWRGWLGDSDVVVTVHNLAAEPVRAAVTCATEAGETDPWLVDVPARGESRAFGTVLSKFATLDPCRAVLVERSPGTRPQATGARGEGPRSVPTPAP